MAEDTYNGSGIGTLKLVEPDGTPQRIQQESFSGVDGAIASFHGRRERVLQFDGYLEVSNVAGAYAQLLDDVAAIQEYINNVATLVHYFGDTSKSYTYCRLDDYRRYGPIGYNSGYIVTRVRAVFTQLYW